MATLAGRAEIELFSSLDTKHFSQPKAAEVFVRDLTDLTQTVLLSCSWWLVAMTVWRLRWLPGRVVTGHTIGGWSVPAGAWTGNGASV